MPTTARASIVSWSIASMTRGARASWRLGAIREWKHERQPVGGVVGGVIGFAFGNPQSAG
jgi:hypothetical protein